jgi:hypothetical protein
MIDCDREEEPVMTYTLDLTPEQVRRIQAAEQIGIDVTGLLQGVISSLPEAPPTRSEHSGATPPVDEKQAATIAYFQARLKEAQSASPEEMERGEREVAELMRNLNENRVAAGTALVMVPVDPLAAVGFRG